MAIASDFDSTSRQSHDSGQRSSATTAARHELAELNAIVSHSPALAEALMRIDRVAPTNATVLISGETGTGKELVARTIHRRSQRAQQQFVAVNVGAIPDSLLTSELFGHESGAFTGALQRRIGRFEQADRATLFLDEVGELSGEMQVALLRVLQEGEFERLGSSQTRRVNVRVIAATHRVLEDEVEHENFRADLYYRLSVFPIHLPPLRERIDDIPGLANLFLTEIQRKLERHFIGFTDAALARLQAFTWPGNIRQLENIIEQSAILCDESLLDVPAALLDERPGSKPAAAGRLDAVLKESEQQMIESALDVCRGRVSGSSGAAARLGLPPSTLESKIRRYNINKLHHRLPKC